MTKLPKLLPLALAALCSSAWAAGPSSGQSSGPWVSELGSGADGRILLAANETANKPVKGSVAEEELPWYSKNQMHKYLGFGSMALALGTLAAPKEDGGAHENLAKGAAVLGVAAVANGIYAHWDDMDFSWDDPDTRHAILGTLGTLGYLLAVAKGGEGGHAAMGSLGAISMAYAIKITW